LKIRQNTLGADHPDVASSLFSLGDMMASLKRNDEACELLVLCLQISEKNSSANSTQLAHTRALLSDLFAKAKSR